LPGIEERLAKSCTQQALRGVDYIHARRILHRDIKPTNLLLLVAPERELPRLLLADFGIAELFLESAASCASSSVRGTLGYLAPEVFDGNVGPQVDIWALGIVLFEILCGQRPFTGEHLMAMYASLKKTLSFEPLSEAEVGEEAIAFLSRVLAKDASLRPLASEALADAWFAELPVPSSPARLARESELKESVDAYMKSSYFRKVVLSSVASQLDAAKIEGLTQVFEAFDSDGSGSISREELAAGLPGISKLELEYFLEELDANGNNQIDYSEFVACLLQTKRDLIEDVLHHSFSTFDINNDGEITVDELRSMLVGNRSLVSVLPDGKCVEDVIAEIDISGRGAITFAEFRAHAVGEKTSKSNTAAREIESCQLESERSLGTDAPSADMEEKGSCRRLRENARHLREKARAAADSLHRHLEPLAEKSSRLSSLLSEEEALWSRLAELHDEVTALSEDEHEIQQSQEAPAATVDKHKEALANTRVAPLPPLCKAPSATNPMNRTTGNRWHVLSLAKQYAPQAPRQDLPRHYFRRRSKLPALQLHGVLP
jgi:calcium-dependent protein kinase